MSPSRKGEGIHRAMYVATLQCRHVLVVKVGPSIGDRVYCHACGGEGIVAQVTGGRR